MISGVLILRRGVRRGSLGPSSCCWLDVRSDSSVEQFGEGAPGRGHSDGDGEGNGCEHQRRCPHGGTVDAADRNEFVDDQDDKQDAETGSGSGGRRQADASPGKAAEGGGNQTHGGNQNQTLVCVGPPPGAPGSVNHDRKADDADEWNGSRDGRVERADLHSTMERVDGRHHPEHDHDRRKAEGDGAEGTMPSDAAGRDEGGLHDKQQHPEGEYRAVDMKNGAGKRRAHHACLEVGGREADVDADAEQDRHAAIEGPFDRSIDWSIPGLLAECRRQDGVACHGLLPLSMGRVMLRYKANYIMDKEAKLLLRISEIREVVYPLET